MNKEKDLTIRLEPELKSKIQEKAKELGVKIADIAYIYKVEVNAIYKLLRKIKNE